MKAWNSTCLPPVPTVIWSARSRGRSRAFELRGPAIAAFRLRGARRRPCTWSVLPGSRRIAAFLDVVRRCRNPAPLRPRPIKRPLPAALSSRALVVTAMVRRRLHAGRGIRTGTASVSDLRKRPRAGGTNQRQGKRPVGRPGQRPATLSPGAGAGASGFGPVRQPGFGPVREAPQGAGGHQPKRATRPDISIDLNDKDFVLNKVKIEQSNIPFRAESLPMSTTLKSGHDADPVPQSYAVGRATTCSGSWSLDA